MNHDLSTMNNPTPTIFLQLTSYYICNIQIVMKTLPLHRFWLDILKKTKLEAIINWFNH
ncbi:hypothetical protein ABIC45_004170 [Mucilaginibacter rubeus]|jgi:hypothetical protein|uniref:Uncharacterized protein n=1 Tax=Mucilaginibacter gossypii TaxID=551996 RepID=A0A1G8L488_9SPHI|nr:hypothetical protein SAMN03159284_02361 [Mucilaginibacter sp. NFR10]SDI50492.1 hypothetical protein SAMN05192573_12236 [Mucilaginibacter gossypii]